VAQVPDQGAEDRVVDPVELLVGERLDQEERVPACFRQSLRDRILELRPFRWTSPILLRCGDLLGDAVTLASLSGRLTGAMSV
jgi:hypothetical protein